MEGAPDDLLAALCDVDSPGEAAGQGVRIVTFEQMVKDLERLPEASASAANAAAEEAIPKGLMKKYDDFSLYSEISETWNC